MRPSAINYHNGINSIMVGQNSAINYCSIRCAFSSSFIIKYEQKHVKREARRVGLDAIKFHACQLINVII